MAELITTLPMFGIFVILFIWIWGEKVMPSLKNGKNGKTNGSKLTNEMKTDLKIILENLHSHEERVEVVLHRISETQEKLMSILAQQTELLRLYYLKIDKIEDKLDGLK